VEAVVEAEAEAEAEVEAVSAMGLSLGHCPRLGF
jgi:hypothetical protein